MIMKFFCYVSCYIIEFSISEQLNNLFDFSHGVILYVSVIATNECLCSVYNITPGVLLFAPKTEVNLFD